jgi:hypothetical protein
MPQTILELVGRSRHRPHGRQIVNFPTVGNPNAKAFHIFAGGESGNKRQVFGATCR